ncbi:hypothetical protein FKP32DRAFT_1613257 [Trametes sanguinea]|nr:hypothetical protein FKP32DRAFT_1613257 [Trametes sanguinea]
MGLALDLSAVISTTLEGILYGFSIFMFGVTMYILKVNARRLDSGVNRKMVAMSCLLLHMIIDIVRTCRGFVFERDTYPGGPVAFFEQPSESTFVAKNAVYTVQTVLGDGILIYRCYIVWQSWLIIAFPLVLPDVELAVVGILCVHSAAVVPQGAGTVFLTDVGRWITAFYSSTLATNFIVTILLGYKIWMTNRRISGMRQNSLLPVVRVIADAGILYSVTLTAALACFVQKSNGQYLVLDIVTPIISITFYMVIIRVGLAETHRSSGPGSHSFGEQHNLSQGIASRGGVGEPRAQALPMNRLPVKVHVTKVYETDGSTTFDNLNDTGSESDTKATGLDVANAV